MNRTGIGFALLSALLFGASAPVAKLLLDVTDPWMLAGLLYLGAGLGLAAVSAARAGLGLARPEAPLRRHDLPWLGLVVLFGGLLGPVLMMSGLARTDAASASLLLNLEGVATLVLAWTFFGENVDRRLMLGAALIMAGAAALSWQGGAGLDAGGGLIALACLCWGLDNNLTRKLSSSDPIQIAMIKGLTAGAVNLGLAAVGGAGRPDMATVAAAGLTGLLGYGVSIALFVLALRDLGAARTGAYFSLAPFVGAVLAVALLGDPLSWALGLAAVLMAVGTWLHLTEHHDHAHDHEAMEHEHRHRHDLHHRHAHGPDDPPGEPHSHWHRHEPMRHSHPHYPDQHHRHGH